MSRLEDLIRATLSERAADAPDGTGLLDAVHERASRSRRRARPVAALAVALVIVVAIAGGVAVVAAGHRGSGSPASTISRLSTPESTTAATSTTSTSTPSTTAPAEVAGCVHTPTQKVQDSYYGLAAPAGKSLDYVAAHVYLPADDGNGNHVQVDGLSLDIVRHNGTVTLTGAILRAFGDFDGDGHTDFLVDLDVGGDLVSYIVPGTVPGGTHSPAAVGIHLPRQPIEGPGESIPVGDQNHDGADDLIIDQRLYSGRQLMAVPPGGDIGVMPAPLRTFSNPVAGVLQLVTNAPPSLVEVDVATGSLVVGDARADRLQTGLDEAAMKSGIGPLFSAARVSAWLVDTHVVVEYRFDTRSGETAWRWNLDAPCES